MITGHTSRTLAQEPSFSTGRVRTLRQTDTSLLCSYGNCRPLGLTATVPHTYLFSDEGSVQVRRACTGFPCVLFAIRHT